MAGHAAVLSYHANRNCFLNLPRAWASKHPRDKIIVYELRTENGVLYTNWAGGISVASSNGLDTVEINGLFAIKQNINHGDEVLVQQIPNIVSCTQVFVEPVSITDWEVLEQNAQNVEANMLNQVRVVWVEQVIPLWVQKSICIFVKIGRTVPEAQVCLLEQNTEVIVTPKVRGMSKQAGDLHKRPRNLDANNENSSNVTYTQVRDLSQNKFVEDLRKAASHYEVNQSGQNSAVSVSCDDVTENKDAVESLPHSSKRNVVKKTLAFMKSLWPWEKSMEYEQSGKSEQSNQQQYVNEYLKDPFDCSLRVQSLDSMLKEFNDDKQEPSNSCEKNMFLRQPNNVFITAETFFCACDSNLTETQPGTFLAKLTKLHSPVECEELAKKKSHFEKDQASSTSGQTASEKPNNYDLLSPEGHNRKGFVVRVVVHDGKISQIHSTSQTNQFKWLPKASSGHVLIPDVLRCQLNLEITAKVRLTAIKENGDVPKRIKFKPMFSLPSGYTSNMLLEAVKVWFEDTSDVCHPLVVNMPTVIQVPLKPDFSGYFLVTYTLSDAKDSHYCLVNSQTLQAVTLSIDDELKQDQLPARLKALCRGTVADLELPVPRIHLDQLGAVSSYIQQAVKHIDVSLAQRPLTQTLFMDCPGLRTGGLLLCGQKGIGKSSLARALCRCASQLPNLAYVAVIECKTLRGKRIEGLRKLFQKVFSEAVWRQPSVILLDDLDHITAAPSGPEQEMSGEALYYTRVSEVLKDIMNKTLTTNAKVTVMATSRSRSSIHQSLVSSRGQHYFQEIVEMKTLDLKRCVPVLRSILLNKPIVDAQCINDLDLDMIANWMEGYVPGDINMVVDRAIHAHYMLTQSDCDDSIKLTMADFTAALDGFTPASLKNVVLHKPGDVGWQNIGGLKEVKKTLIETLQWPAKYPKLFASCPLRLRSGLLLYGAPGTGKTLLAGAVAKECGLNFISIKGPELLSKYIGASEQAVRDTFMRAQAAKPCVLFFDEFDSLAPRRGHDSTGVTDRVVNQLLTQLDGIEGLEGVYVLGATSRPDLIDPALLRPGRLDKVLYCPMPDQDERLEILQSLTHNMTLDPSVDLTYLAITCDNFTGADLKALLYNAQLEAIHDLTGQTSLSEPGQTSSSEPGQTSLSDPGQTSLTKPVSATTNDTADGHQSEQNSNQNKTEVDSNCVVVEKNQRGKVTYIHRLEDGSLDLTPEDEQLLLAQFSKSTTPSVDEKKQTSVTVITQSHLVKALEGMRPSVSATERLKYQMIYANFMASKGANFNIEASAVGRKATLA